MKYIDSNVFSIKVNREATTHELGKDGRVQSTIIIYKGGAKLTPVSSTPTVGEFRVAIKETKGCLAAIKDLDTVYATELTSAEGVITLDINVEGKTNFVKNIKLIKSVHIEEIENVETRMKIAEQKITKDAITNVIKEDFYTKGEVSNKMSAVEQTVDSWGVRITENSNEISSLKLTSDEFEVKINENANEISSLKLTNEEFDVRIGNKADRSNVISMINASTEGITISSSKVNITGFVTFSDLSTSGSTTINGSNIKSGTIRGIQIISNTSDSLSRVVMIDDGLRFYSPSKQAGKISFDSNGEGTEWSARDRFLVQSVNGYALKILSSGDLSITAVDQIFLEATNGVFSNCNLDIGNNRLNCQTIYCGGNGTFNTLTSNSNTNIKGTLTVSGTTTINSDLYVEGILYGWGGTELGNKSLWTGVGTASRDYLKLDSHYIMSDSSYGVLITNTSGNWANVRGATFYGNGTVLTSDARLKTDIKYVNTDEQTVGINGLVSPNVNITTGDMHEFIETLPMISYRLISELNENKDNTYYGFLIQDIMETKVGSELAMIPRDEYGNETNDYYTYSQNKFIAFICGALQEEIKQRKLLEEKLNQYINKEE